MRRRRLERRFKAWARMVWRDLLASEPPSTFQWKKYAEGEEPKKLLDILPELRRAITDSTGRDIDRRWLFHQITGETMTPDDLKGKWHR